MSTLGNCLKIRSVGLQHHATFGSVTFCLSVENISRKPIKEAIFHVTPINRYGLPTSMTLSATCMGIGPYASGMFNRQNIGKIEKTLWRWDTNNKITGCHIEKVEINFMDGSKETFGPLGNLFIYQNCIANSFF